MFYKIPGLLMMTPLIAAVISFWWWKYTGEKWDDKEYLDHYVASIILLLIAESFGFGLYLLFK